MMPELSTLKVCWYEMHLWKIRFKVIVRLKLCSNRIFAHPTYRKVIALLLAPG